jgi:hypothetical protein
MISKNPCHPSIRFIRDRIFPESDLRPIFALQHLAYCERQCCLIHIEQAWAENRLTAKGRILHQHVHEHDAESRGDVYIVRGLKLRWLEHGLSGVADVVEFHRVESQGISLPGKRGQWKPFPVKYKRGKLEKPNRTCRREKIIRPEWAAYFLATIIARTSGNHEITYPSRQVIRQ